ncbi:DUF2214 domain-containing protein [Aquabacter cavernae]|uniref:DUF2214 domain-containing protein n=1 Tax=Aquabacter cavernae TaxID=2496029 RepID=UPI000F8D44D3|nr:DUF2214 domain-containing protein [Aquabacter cavernae]
MTWLEALSHWQVAAALRHWVSAYALVNAAHIIGIGLLIGAIATLDLRLLGAFRASSLQDLAPPLSRMAAFGLLLAVCTGFLLFCVRPVAYAENPAFLTKLALVALGTANALALRASGGWRRVKAGGPASMRVKIAAVLSLVLWTGAVLCGRWIGFSQE